MGTSTQKGRLGRGLASLIGEPANTATVQQLTPRAASDGQQRLIAIDLLAPSQLNPRKDFREAELEDLAHSIKAKGLVQPIIVRPDPLAGGRYEIVAGERRWRAAQKAKLHDVPVIVRELSDQEVLELAIIENVQRSDLNAIEEAGGYRELIERFNYSQDQVSEIIGKSRSHVANTMRLLRLPESVQALVQMGQLSAGHARALIGRKDAEQLAERILAENLNVREVEALVQGGLDFTHGGRSGRVQREKDPDTKAFEKELTDALGLKVDIKRGSGESGNLSIKFGNFDQLEYIRQRLTGIDNN